jgi:arginine/ornithine N-succinyltransferase beta subunit
MSKHDQRVALEANNLSKEGYRVLAHIDGFKTPPKINGFIPDIYAIGDQVAVIIEVETSMDVDKEQRRAFKKYANQYSNIIFDIILV